MAKNESLGCLGCMGYALWLLFLLISSCSNNKKSENKWLQKHYDDWIDEFLEEEYY